MEMEASNEGIIALDDVNDASSDVEFKDTVEQYTSVKNIEYALSRKEIGNNHFRSKQYDESIAAYSEAIEYCPNDTEEGKENLSIFYGNRAACYISLHEYQAAIDDCTEALVFSANYGKVIYRRASAYEALDRLDESLQDLKHVKEIDPAYPGIDRNITRVEKLLETKMSKLKDEALGKLSELGNSILGNFGMSLNDFKATQDPATGSWSIGMNRK